MRRAVIGRSLRDVCVSVQSVRLDDSQFERGIRGARTVRIGLHPETLQKITAEDYSNRTGARTVERLDGFKAADAICEFCRENIYLAGGSSDRVLHFRHRPGGHCPTKIPAGRPYLELTPVDGDPTSGAHLRSDVRRNWKRHFSALSNLVPFLSPEEFTSLLEIASERRVWDYRGLQEENVPYVLVLVADFPPWTSIKRNGRPERKLWFRFMYRSQVQSISDLWIRPSERPVLYRTSFISPKHRNGRPAYEDLQLSKPMDESLPPRDPPDFVAKSVEGWFSRSRHFQD